MQSIEQRNYNWIKLENVILYTTYDAFLFLDYSFYFRMLKNVIDNLIPTGVMKYMIENFYTKNWKFEKAKVEPQILKIDDLLFGFKIWIGSCLLSLFAFICERIAILLISVKSMRIKINFAKIHPKGGNESYEQKKHEKNIFEKFRIPSVAKE